MSICFVDLYISKKEFTGGQGTSEVCQMQFQSESWKLDGISCNNLLMGFAPGAVSGEKKKVKGGEKLVGYRWQGSPNVRYDSGVGIKVDCRFLSCTDWHPASPLRHHMPWRLVCQSLKTVPYMAVSKAWVEFCLCGASQRWFKGASGALAWCRPGTAVTLTEVGVHIKK